MKPHPHLVTTALEVAGCAPDAAVFVGDSVTDVAAGHAGGVRVIAYANKSGKRERLLVAGSLEELVRQDGTDR